MIKLKNIRESNTVVFYKTFPYLIEIICSKCKHKEIYSLKFELEDRKDMEVNKILKDIKK